MTDTIYRPDNPVLPAVMTAERNVQTHTRCQLVYVVANELVREQHMGWIDAYREGDVFVAATETGGGPLGLGLGPGEVNWQEFGCIANQYAMLPASDRNAARERLASGAQLWAFGVDYIYRPDAVDSYESNLCRREILEEYAEEPGCVPPKPMRLGLIAGGAFFGTLGILLGLRVLGIPRKTLVTAASIPVVPP